MRPSYTFSDLEKLMNNAKKKIHSFNEIPDELFIKKPHPKSWSADEVCSHLVKFNNLYIKQMDHAVKKLDSKSRSNGPFRTGLIQNGLIKFIEPPYKVKMKTLAPMYPDPSGVHPQETINLLLQTIHELQNRIKKYQSEKLDLKKVKGRNPVFRFLPMSLIDFILYLDAHQRRHFWQIEQTIKKLSAES